MPPITQLLLVVYLLAINIVAFTAMGLDKKRAIKKQFRIPEKTLFFYALIGGGLGATCGMVLFRHKTRHWYFRVFFPMLAILQTIGILFLYLHIVA